MLASAGTDQTVSAQEPAAGPAAESAVPLEEVTVYGDVSLTALRLAVFAAEDNFFSAFNELNSRKAFDIHCNPEASTGTRLTHRVCEANFVADITTGASRDFLWGLTTATPGTVYSVNQVEMARMENLLRGEMTRLIAEHPGLADSLREVTRAKERYEAERSRRCERRKRLCQ